MTLNDGLELTGIVGTALVVGATLIVRFARVETKVAAMGTTLERLDKEVERQGKQLAKLRGAAEAAGSLGLRVSSASDPPDER